jgi:mono/diheme cytochrome c family protein
MRASVAVFLMLLLAGFAGSGSSQEKKEPQKEPAEFKIPAEEAKRENPIKPTESSIAQGRRLFSSQCAMCHGKDGDGKGELADIMKLKLRDYSDPAALKDMTDGELFYILSHGKGQMPDQEGRMKDDQKWHLINYIRSRAKSGAPAKPKGEKPQE